MGADSPDAWARDNRADVARYARRIGEITARSRDVCLPGVPLALVFAFFANNGLDENTTSWVSGSAREREEALAKGRKPLGGNPREGYGNVTSDDLHEVGPGGVEANHCPDEVATGDCPWVTGARSSDVAKILGHSTLAVTMRYAHFAPEAGRAGIEKLGRALAAGRTSAGGVGVPREGGAGLASEQIREYRTRHSA